MYCCSVVTKNFKMQRNFLQLAELNAAQRTHKRLKAVRKPKGRFRKYFDPNTPNVLLLNVHYLVVRVCKL